MSTVEIPGLRWAQTREQAKHGDISREILRVTETQIFLACGHQIPVPTNLKVWAQVVSRERVVWFNEEYNCAVCHALVMQAICALIPLDLLPTLCPICQGEQRRKIPVAKNGGMRWANCPQCDGFGYIKRPRLAQSAPVVVPDPLGVTDADRARWREDERFRIRVAPDHDGDSPEFEAPDIQPRVAEPTDFEECRLLNDGFLTPSSMWRQYDVQPDPEKVRRIKLWKVVSRIGPKNDAVVYGFCDDGCWRWF